MMDNVVYWVRNNDSVLGFPKLAGNTPTNHLAVPMMLLCILLELMEMDAEHVEKKYQGLDDWCVEQLLPHIKVLSLGQILAYASTVDHYSYRKQA